MTEIGHDEHDEMNKKYWKVFESLVFLNNFSKPTGEL